MQVAPTQRRKTPPAIAVVPAKGAAGRDRGQAPREIVERARQDYLDALPIAAAVLHLDAGGGIRIDMANSEFRRISDGHSGKAVAAEADLLPPGEIGLNVADFLDGAEPSIEFEGSDGNVGGRHFIARVARLKPTTYAGKRCLLSLIDKTAQVETEKSLRAEMLRDSLTGLPNRLAFNERVEEILEHPNFVSGSYAVIVLDMVRFSRVNECMGAIAGDELLITFARRLFSALRAGDVLARTGGDEFGILIRLDRGLKDALEFPERIKEVLSTPFRLSDLEIRVDCSIGCALLTGDVELSEEALRNAQFAMKRSKLSGRPQVYEPGQAQAARQRFSLETELRRAIEADQLKLAFQPLIELKTGQISGFEALARWDHEERGPIPPAEFIPVAEESGLIVSLGRWALDAAAQTLADWDRQSGKTLPIYIAVNLSAIQIARDDIAAAVGDALRSSGISGERLMLELTESAIIQDPQRATKVLEALKGFEARVAMDDFGTGYTSLSYLQRLPIDVLKIDRSFVSGMLSNKDSVAIVRAILSLADALGMATTAEGIDSAELARALTMLGCTYGQGFHYAEALPPDAALAYWLSRSA
jgi:diguanylate cyclase (GGDEF)-like protein